MEILDILIYFCYIIVTIAFIVLPFVVMNISNNVKELNQKQNTIIELLRTMKEK